MTQDNEKATVNFLLSNSIDFKSVICSDGIHSIGKNAIFPPHTFGDPEHSGFCVYYGIMKDYPDTMQFPAAYEIDCDGALLGIAPLVNKEALLIILHSKSTQDDPNAWSYACSVEGKL